MAFSPLRERSSASVMVRPMGEAMAKTPEQQRRAVVRTAWLLAAVAVASYALFLYSATHAK